MKIIMISSKLILINIILALAISSISTFKAKTRLKTQSRNRNKVKIQMSNKTKLYDDNATPGIMKELFHKFVDLKEDKSNLYKPCMTTILDNTKYSDGRRKFWSDIEKFVEEKNQKILNPKLVKDFFTLVNPEISTPTSGKQNCGDYILEMLQSDQVLSSEIFGQKIRTYLENSLGIYQEQIKKKGSTFITSFGSVNRDNPLRSSSMFKKLNGK